MGKAIIERVMKVPLWANGLAAALSLGAFQWIKGKLDQSYAASGHPVDYATGQTSFSGETIKGYYAHMSEAGTLEIYRQTQIIDFGFIAALFCFALFGSALIARIGHIDSWGRRVAIISGLSIMLGTFCDIAENLISFVMLMNPTSFANWLALPYSGFAVVKFFLIAAGMFGLLIAIVLIILGRVLNKEQMGCRPRT